MEEPKKMDLRSMDITEEHKAKLKELFPNVFNEDKIDFGRLKQTLGEEVDTGLERFGLTWPGKAECMKIIQQPSIGTLKPCKEESVNFDTTENLFIEGDNLEVLKLLQKSYYGKIKMIYIDPPYNTGKEFIYPDKYSESLETYLAYTGQVDAEGKKFSTNTEVDGRFHSKWLNMMYPRLFLARNLLREDGAIFISIDDNELNNLKKLCDELFGEENFLANIIWEKVHTRKNSTKYFSVSHDYVLAYAKLKERWDRHLLPRENTDAYKNPDNDPKGPWKLDPITAHNYYSADYKIRKPNGVILSRPQDRYWALSEDTWLQKVENKEISWGEGDSYPMVKRYLSEVQDGLVPVTIFDRKFAGDTSQAKGELDALLGMGGLFDYPKPSKLIKRLIQISAGPDDAILDFFAGSCPTAQAVLSANKEEKGNRKFIMVQLPEKCDIGSEPAKAGYKTIADIGKERIRRAIKKINEETATQLAFDQKKLDLGVKVFKLNQSNFKIWDGAVEETIDGKKIEKQLELQIEHINPKSTEEDILYELLLKSGFPLTTKVEVLELAGKKVYSIESGALLICLEKNLTKEVITEMARKEPARVICLDTGFSGNDQLKTNAVQIMKSHKVEDFRTV